MTTLYLNYRMSSARIKKSILFTTLFGLINLAIAIRAKENDGKTSFDELCSAIIAYFWIMEQIPEEEQDPSVHLMKSSLFAVACLHKGLLNSHDEEYARSRLVNRCYKMFKIVTPGTSDYKVITLNDIFQDLVNKKII